MQKGGGLEEGGLKIAPDRREADDGKRSSGRWTLYQDCFSERMLE